MSTFLVFLPGVIVILYFYLYPGLMNTIPVARAFLLIYLPTVLLIPHNFSPNTPFLPNLNFSHYAIIPIFIAFLIFPGKKQLTLRKGIRLLDVLVVSYVIVIIYSEYYNSGMNDIVSSKQSLWLSILYRHMLNIILPYYLARKLIHGNGLTKEFGKVLIVCCLISLIISVYEWKMVINPHIVLLKSFFPDTPDFIWVPSFRFGLVRISGPYDHPILFGTGIATAFILNHWLSKNGFWKKHFSFLFLKSYLKGPFIGALLFIGLFLTLSRGPLYSSIFALPILGLGYSRHRWLYLFGIAATFLVIAAFVLQYIAYYSSLDSKMASSLEGTAIYRVNLINAYVEYAQEKFWLGSGSTTWPKATGMVSIDNAYLFILITHGFLALVLFCSILLVTSLKLFFTGMKIPRQYRINQSLAFTLLGILFMLGITFITVYMAHQVEILTFIFVGLSQGFLDTNPKKQSFYRAS